MKTVEKIIDVVLAPYHFLTRPASYAAAGEPEIEDPVVKQVLRIAQIQLREADTPIIDVSVEKYRHLEKVLERGPGPLDILGVPIRPTNWKDLVDQPGLMWTTRGGEKIHVGFMSNTHLIHTEAYLARNGAKRTPRYAVIKGELNKRVRRGLDAGPIEPYDVVDEISDDELGDNRKTMGYRKQKFGTTPVPSYVHEDYVDSLYRFGE